MLEQSRTWLKQFGLVSFGKTKALGDDVINQMVGRFESHITGPSSVHPLTKLDATEKKPGIVVCELNTTQTATIEDVMTFVRKMEMTIALKNLGRCLFVYISTSFT